MRILHIISNVDYCDDYNYILNFDDSNKYEYGTPIFIFDDVNIDKLKNEISRVFNNVPNLQYLIEPDMVKIKYYSNCNKRFIDIIQKILSDSDITSFNVENLMVACNNNVIINYNTLINTNHFIRCRDNRVHEYRYLKDNSEIKITFTKITEKNKKIFATFVKLCDLHTSFDVHNKLRLVYHLDDEYWNFTKIKNNVHEQINNFTTLNNKLETIDKTYKEQLYTLNKKIENIQLQSNLNELENIDIATMKENLKIDNTRNISDNVKYIYSFICKIFNYLNNNEEELKTIVLNLQEIIQEIKIMYEKMEIKQDELYTKTLTPEEQKQLEEEKEQKQLEEEKKKQLEEEQQKITRSKLDSIMNKLTNLASAFDINSENDPNMKDIMNMYEFVQNNEPKVDEK